MEVFATTLSGHFETEFDSECYSPIEHLLNLADAGELMAINHP